MSNDPLIPELVQLNKLNNLHLEIFHPSRYKSIISNTLGEENESQIQKSETTKKNTHILFISRKPV